MKIKIENYTFNKVAKTITFTDYTTIRLDAVILIVNTTSNIEIYNFLNPLKGGTVLGNVLTLTYDTSSMNNLDALAVYYDDVNIETATTEKQDELIDEITNKDIMIALKVLAVAIANPSWVDKSVNSLKVASHAVTLSTTNVGTVANVTNMGSFPADHLQKMNNYAAWQLTVRNKIT